MSKFYLFLLVFILPLAAYADDGDVFTAQTVKRVKKPLSANGMNVHNEEFPIKKGTCEIFFHYHTHSGLGISRSVTIYPDHLIWHYSEGRNECSLTDSIRYDKKEFEALITELSQISFKAEWSVESMMKGRGGSSFSFYDQSRCYFEFYSDYELSGDYEKVIRLIVSFANVHKTNCERLFERLSERPHQKAEYGEFEVLPKELRKYQHK